MNPEIFLEVLGATGPSVPQYTGENFLRWLEKRDTV